MDMDNNSNFFDKKVYKVCKDEIIPELTKLGATSDTLTEIDQLLKDYIAGNLDFRNLVDSVKEIRNQLIIDNDRKTSTNEDKPKINWLINWLQECLRFKEEIKEQNEKICWLAQAAVNLYPGNIADIREEIKKYDDGPKIQKQLDKILTNDELKHKYKMTDEGDIISTKDSSLSFNINMDNYNAFDRCLYNTYKKHIIPELTGLGATSDDLTEINKLLESCINRDVDFRTLNERGRELRKQLQEKE